LILATKALSRLLAHGMHVLCVMTCTLATTACVVPLGVEVDSEHRPTFASASPSFGGPRIFYRSVDPVNDVRESEFTVTVRDPDEQTIEVKMIYLGPSGEYTAVPLLGVTQLSPTSTTLRTTDLRVPGLCDQFVNFDPGPHVIEIYASDTGFDTESESLVQPNAGGLLANAWWLVECRDP